MNKMKANCVCKGKKKTYSKRMKSFSKINTFYFILNWNKQKKNKGRKNVTGNQNITALYISSHKINAIKDLLIISI